MRNQRSFLCIIDNSPELRAAIRYTARRASKVNAHIILLGVIPPFDGGAEMMFSDIYNLVEQEERQIIQDLCDYYRDIVTELSEIVPSVIITEGIATEVIKKKISEYPDIKILILGTGFNQDPGPLVKSLMQGQTRLKIPVTLVPGDLQDDEIDSLA